MPARILDGKALAETIRGNLAEQVAEFRARTGAVPGLAAVLVGEDPASEVYVRNKRQACKAAGMLGSLHRFSAGVSEPELLAKVDELNANPAVHGILVQLPLPGQIDDQKVIERIDPRKDVDGFHPENVGLLAIGRPRFVPCTPLGVERMLKAAEVVTQGARAVVLGRSNIVGKPMALLMMRKGCDATVTVCHTATRDTAAIAREADILVAATGQPRQVTAEWVKPGAVVVDVGIHRRDDGTLCGDVEFESVAPVASWITPVPGGVGRMTIAMLLHNTLAAARLQHP